MEKCVNQMSLKGVQLKYSVHVEYEAILDL